LEQAARAAGWRTLRVDRSRLRKAPAIEQFPRSGDERADFAFAAKMLATAGLGEAALFLRRPDRLSDGERWRLRLAVTVARLYRLTGHDRLIGQGGRIRPTLLVADEFAAVLDRTTAAGVARGLRRTIDRLARVGIPVAAAVATSHDDLQPALLPDRVERCEWGLGLAE
jgi:ABC-type ATPase with predicted acetyltransferase domain